MAGGHITRSLCQFTQARTLHFENRPRVLTVVAIRRQHGSVAAVGLSSIDATRRDSITHIIFRLSPQLLRVLWSTCIPAKPVSANVRVTVLPKAVSLMFGVELTKPADVDLCTRAKQDGNKVGGDEFAFASLVSECDFRDGNLGAKKWNQARR